MTRTEIIAQIDAEIALLERAREILSAPLKQFLQPSVRKIKNGVPPKVRQQAITTAAPAGASASQARSVVNLPAPQPSPEPEVKRVPPKRRIERRSSPSEKAAKSPVALSGMVPTGPVVVSADEARKIQERNTQSAAEPAVAEMRPENSSERTLGSLIQAFERRSGLSAIETPRS